MSFYNLVHGQNPMAPVLLAMLGLTIDDIPRYRDCWWDGQHVVIHTRTGGGNREFYDSRASHQKHFGDQPDHDYDGPFNSDLRSLATFVSEADDTYDPTYATFLFRLPTSMEWMIPKITTQSMSPAERWRQFMDKLENTPDDPQVVRVKAAFAPLFEEIQKVLNAVDKHSG